MGLEKLKSIFGLMQEADPLLGSLTASHHSRPRSATEGEGSGAEEGEHMDVAAGDRGSPSHLMDPSDPHHSELDRISSSTSSLSLSSECVCVCVVLVN